MGKGLLIIGAGGHGKVVSEVAEDCGYTKIEFLDDNSPKAVGKISDLIKFKEIYEYAFVGIGNNELRDELIQKLESVGYRIPILVHPTAYVSKTANIEKGTVVEAKAVVNTNTKIGKGCIVSIGAIVDHDATVGKCCHINSGAIVKSGVELRDFVKLESGETAFGYGIAKIK